MEKYKKQMYNFMNDHRWTSVVEKRTLPTSQRHLYYAPSHSSHFPLLLHKGTHYPDFHVTGQFLKT